MEGSRRHHLQRRDPSRRVLHLQEGRLPALLRAEGLVLKAELSRSKGLVKSASTVHSEPTIAD